MRVVITRREGLDIPDGINIFIFSLADELIRRGHDVIAVSSTFTEAANVKQYFGFEKYPKIISLSRDKRPHNFSIAATWALRGRAIVDRLRPDLILINGALPVKFKAKSLTLSHDLEKRGIGWARILYKRFAYRRSDLIAATCSELQVALGNELLIDANRIQVIPTCFDIRSYKGQPLHNRSNAILHMGTVSYKNPVATVTAFARLPGVPELYITGTPTRELETALNTVEPGVRARIKLLGYVPAPALKGLLGTVKVVSAPSVYALPVASPTVIEPLASGTPVVGSESISCDVLIDGYNGYRVAARDEDAIRNRFEQLLFNEDAWSTMSANASRHAWNFSAQSVAERCLSIAARG